MGIRSVERRLERAVEGLFGRMFKSSVRPVEIGRKLVRATDDGRSVGVQGEAVVPNSFAVRLEPDDLAEFADVEETLIRELAESVRDHARDEGYRFLGPLQIHLEADPSLRTGMCEIDARMLQADGGAGAGSLVLPTGERIVLGEFVATIGRLAECTVTLADTNVSRTHVEIRPHANGYKLIDLGSTNGTLVNGVRVREHVLSDTDVIEIGVTSIVFEAS
ncbi:MAG: DUF3662 domain-containing protein [Acidimicrobiales bacterium]|nr:DUF3662 domain-containing protein [Acidimicrobiales bacterium]